MKGGEVTRDRAPLLEVSGLSKHFPVTRGLFGRKVAEVRAVDRVSFSLTAGETLALVGESGSGKTTTGRSILRLIEPSAGSVRFAGTDLRSLDPEALRAVRKKLQIIFQDPFSSLNPRMRVMDIIGEPLRVHDRLPPAEVEARVFGLLDRVGLPRAWAYRYPHEFSGGQRQRVGIARALAPGPELIVCDEAVSALDVSIRAQIINLLIDLQAELGLSYLFIAHDLSVVRHIADRIAVMYLGQIVEIGDKAEVFDRPAHPYTRALLASVPHPDPRRQRRFSPLEGEVPSPLDPPAGCRFHTRCPVVFERCRREEPRLYQLGPRQARCFHAEDFETAAIDATLSEAAYAELGARLSPPIAVSSMEGVEVAEVRDSPAAAAAGAAVEIPAAHHASAPKWPRLEARHLRPAIGLGLGLCALWATVTGSAGWVLLLVPLAYGVGVCPATESGPRRASWGVGVAAVGLALASLAFAAGRTRQQAQQQYRALGEAIAGFEAARQRLPESLTELDWRLPLIFGGRSAIDPWGAPWRYQIQVSDPEPARGAASVPRKPRYRLGSFGPDGKPGADDIGDPE